MFILENSKKLGDSITLVSGRASHSKASDGFETGELYRGKYATELAIALHLVSTDPVCPMPGGTATLSKRKLTRHGVQLMRMLFEHEEERLIQKKPDEMLALLPGSKVYAFITDLGWVWKGFNNMKLYDHLSIYESSKCFRGIRESFHRCGRLKFCDCTSRCLLKRSLVAMMAISYDFCVEMASHGVQMTLSDIFERAMVDIFVGFCTSDPDEPGVFVAGPDVGTNIVLHKHATKFYLADRRLRVEHLYSKDNRHEWASDRTFAA